MTLHESRLTEDGRYHDHLPLSQVILGFYRSQTKVYTTLSIQTSAVTREAEYWVHLVQEKCSTETRLHLDTESNNISFTKSLLA